MLPATVKSAIEYSTACSSLTLAAEAAFQGADVSRPESARDEELAAGG